MTKILDWSSTGYVTAAIESSVHLWSERSQCIRYTVHAASETLDKSSAKTMVRCVRWDAQGEQLAYSYSVYPGSVTGPNESFVFDDPSSPTAAWHLRDPEVLFGHSLDTSPPARNVDRDESGEWSPSTTTAASSRHDDDDRDAAATKKTNHVKVGALVYTNIIMYNVRAPDKLWFTHCGVRSSSKWQWRILLNTYQVVYRLPTESLR